MIPVSLLRKELRQLLPWALTMLFVELAGTAVGLIAVSPDETVWAATAPIFDGGAIGRGFVIGLWAFVVVYAGFPREHDDETLPFLFALPIGRWTLFIAKFLAGALVLLSAVVLGELLRWLIQLPNPTSFGGRTFRVEWALAALGLSSAVTLIMLAYAHFFSVFRGFGLLAAFIVWSSLELLADRQPALRLLNPFRLLEVQFHGSQPLVSWPGLTGHGAAATALAGVAAYVWVGPVERWATVVRRSLDRTPVKLVFASLVAAVVIGVAVTLAESESFESHGQFGLMAELDSPAATLESRAYRFRYPSALSGRMQRIAPIADRNYGEIARQLQAPVSGAPIQVNMLESSATHAGSATWETIRLDLDQAYADHRLQRTLAHETAHVMALRASDRRIDAGSQALRIFNEGLAEHIALWIAPDPAELEARWLEAVLAYRRFRIDTSQLFAADTFVARFGDHLIYPIGLTWLTALTDACGADVPARVLRALARPDAPKDLRGEVLWRDTLQAIRCDSNQVALRWSALLETRAESLRAELARIPVLGGGISRRSPEDEIVLRMQPQTERGTEPLEGVVHYVLVRTSPEDDAAKYERYPGRLMPDGSVEYWVSTASVSGQMLDFQFVIAWVRSESNVRHAAEWQRSRVP